MPPIYKLVAAPHLLPGGDFKGHLETVTFIAANENETHKWWAVNVGTFEKDFTKIVSPELAQNIMTRLRQGEIVEFPNRYELSQVKGRFGGCFMDYRSVLDFDNRHSIWKLCTRTRTPKAASVSIR